MSGVQKIAALVHVTQEMVDDARFDLNGSLAKRLMAKLLFEAGKLELEIILGTFEIERVVGGFWFDVPRSLWRRFLRRPAERRWVETVAFRAEVAAKEPVSGGGTMHSTEFHGDQFAAMTILDQDRHMRDWHRRPTVLFCSRSYSIELHEAAHEAEAAALGQTAESER